MASEAPFRFLDLPAELRNEIYRLAFQGGTYLISDIIYDDAVVRHHRIRHEITGYRGPHSKDDTGKALVLPKPLQTNKHYIGQASGILTISKQIHREAILLYYATTRFQSSDRIALMRWMQALSPRKAAALRLVRYRYHVCRWSEDDTLRRIQDRHVWAITSFARCSTALEVEVENWDEQSGRKVWPRDEVDELRLD